MAIGYFGYLSREISNIYNTLIKKIITQRISYVLTYMTSSSLVLRVAVLVAICSVAFSTLDDIRCGDSNKAYVWNCQTLLDNWYFDDYTYYYVFQDNCIWQGLTHGTSFACKLLENDSCTLVISTPGSMMLDGITGDSEQVAKYPGFVLKEFVQQAINQCTDGDSQVNAVYSTDRGTICLVNHENADTCW